MSFLEPAGLFFLATLPAIAVLYFLKLKRRRVVVPSTLLWERVATELRANTPFQRLRTSLLLLLQLLMAALLALALARPYLAGIGRLADERILVLDASASMTAVGADGRSRFDAARRVARDLLAGDEGARTMIILAGPRPRVLQPLTADRRQLEAALAEARPTEAPADLGRAVALALALSRGQESRDVVLLSDGAGPALPDAYAGASGLRLVTVGEKADNLGITSFDCARSSTMGSDWELFVGVTNFGAAERQARVVVSIDGASVDARGVTVPPGQTRGVVVPLAGRGGEVVEAALQPGDALACDDRAVGILPRAGDRRVAVVSPTGSLDPWLRRALAPYPRLKVEPLSPSDPVRPGDVDLVIFDGVTPRTVEPGSYLFLDPRGPVVSGDAPGAPLFTPGPTLEYPVILDWRRSSPLLRYVGLGDVHLREARPLRPGEGVEPLVETEAGPIAVADLRGGVRFAALGFDFRASDMPYRAAFPVLLGNALGELPWAGGGDAALTRPAGQVARLAAVSEGAAAVVDPAGRRHALAPGADAFEETWRVGLYRVSLEDAPASSFGVSLLSPEESNLEPRLRIRAPAAPGQERQEARSVRRELFPLLIGVAILVLLAEWAAYHRRSFA